MEQEMLDIEAQRKQDDQLKSSSTMFKKPNQPVTLKFDEVVYTVKIPKESKLFKKNPHPTQEKLILKGVTGMVKPGEVLAMLGPSGSGKTTLLTALGGRLGGGKLGGKITYNNQKFSNKMKRNTGFVTQDDVMYPHLTVKETLVFTALLRLPNCYSTDEKVNQAEQVITQLGLAKVRDSIIGGPFLRGISGGERKRVSVGQEMLINPSLLLLDEPTSGLDSTTAQRIVSILWDLGNSGGRTIVMTIHQPSSRLFYMFHKVILLSEGNCLYFGKGSKVMEYFNSVGFAPSMPMNPADFLLDLANGTVSDNESHENQAIIKQNLVAAYKNNLLDKLKTELNESNDYSFDYDSADTKQCALWATTWWQQFTVLLKRGVKERRHEVFSAIRVGQLFVVAILSGLLWWQSEVNNIQDRVGLLFFLTGFWGVVPVFQAIFTFPQERAMLEKERSSGMYRLSSYFISRTFGDLPMDLVLPTCFLLITYWMSGLKPTALNFFETLFALLLCVLVSQGIGLAIGAIVMNQKSASMLGSVLMLSFQLAGGYYVQNMPAFISWIKYISIINHSYKLLVVSQYKATDTYPCGGGSCLVSDYPSLKDDFQGTGLSILALVVMMVGYRLIAYIALMRVGKTRI